MILGTLNFLVDYLTLFLRLRDNATEVVLGKFPDDANGDGKLTITLMNIEENKVNKEPYRQERVRNTDGTYSFVRYNPDTKLNLFVAFSYNPPDTAVTDYSAGIRAISYVVQAFQNKYSFSGGDFALLESDIDAYNVIANTPPGNKPIIDKIYFNSTDEGSLVNVEAELHTQSIDQVANTWQALGGFSIPFVIYRVKTVLVSSEPDDREGAGEILEIGINTGRIS